ncbi:MAG: type II toxin-antitoxin system RelE/ParE family toxin [Defluviitaleaceae bacterium]|nr:type II toxin-antitoxin system RelE/ParE family toxin [Defluviitaleaceae bacterium]
MDKFKIILRDDASDDLRGIIAYIASDNPTAAKNMQRKFREKIKGLALFPRQGRIIPEETLAEIGFRMISTGSYTIFYLVKEDTVLIYRILHSARDYPTILACGKDL